MLDSEAYTYRGVDGLVALHVAILAETVVSLAEGDTGDEARDQAGLKGVEAVEETAGPGGRALVRLGVDVLARLGEDGVETVLPVIHISLVNGTLRGATGRTSSGLSLCLRDLGVVLGRRGVVEIRHLESGCRG